jgi:hypothetical protein
MAKRKCPWVAEANKKRKGYKHSEETKAKIAASVKKQWDESPDDPRRTDTSREAVSKKAKRSWDDPEFRAEASERAKEQWSDPEFRQQASERAKIQWEDPEFRQEASDRTKAQWQDPEYVAKQQASRANANRIRSQKAKSQWADPDRRALLMAGIMDAWDDNDRRAAVGELRKLDWEDPKYAERMAELLREVNLGRELSDETKDKISAGIARAMVEGRFNPSKLSRFKQGTHHSPKTGDDHHYRSSYELRAYQLLDADPDVALYITEPMVLHYEFNGQPRRYIPDLYIEYIDGSWSIVEVKPLYQLNWPSVQAKIACAQDALRWDYDVWTEVELYA